MAKITKIGSVNVFRVGAIIMPSYPRRDTSFLVNKVTMLPPTDPLTSVANIQLNWVADSDATGYLILSSADGITWAQLADAGAALTYTDVSATTAGSVKYYKVVAYSGNTTNVVRISPAVKVTAPTAVLTAPVISYEIIPPLTPFISRELTPNVADVRLTWDQIPGAVGYYVYQSSDDINWVLVADIPADHPESSKPEYIDRTDLAFDEVRHYKVEAYDPDPLVMNAASDQVTIVVPAPITLPNPISPMGAYDRDGGSVIFSFSVDDPTNKDAIVRIEVERATDQDPGPLVADFLKENNDVLDPATGEFYYTYQITSETNEGPDAFCRFRLRFHGSDGGVSAWSEEYTVPIRDPIISAVYDFDSDIVTVDYSNITVPPNTTMVYLYDIDSEGLTRVMFTAYPADPPDQISFTPEHWRDPNNYYRMCIRFVDENSIELLKTDFVCLYVNPQPLPVPNPVNLALAENGDNLALTWESDDPSLDANIATAFVQFNHSLYNDINRWEITAPLQPPANLFEFNTTKQDMDVVDAGKWIKLKVFFADATEGSISNSSNVVLYPSDAALTPPNPVNLALTSGNIDLERVVNFTWEVDTSQPESQAVYGEIEVQSSTAPEPGWHMLDVLTSGQVAGKNATNLLAHAVNAGDWAEYRIRLLDKTGTNYSNYSNVVRDEIPA